MTPEQQKQYEEIKLEQYLEWAKKNRPSILARLLGALKKGKVEKVSPHKADVCRSNLEKGREALKIKREQAKASLLLSPNPPETS